MGTTRLVSRRRQDSGSAGQGRHGGLATIGVIDTGSITLKRWGLLVDLNCPIGADGRDKVLNSPWEAWVMRFHCPWSAFWPMAPFC